VAAVAQRKESQGKITVLEETQGIRKKGHLGGSPPREKKKGHEKGLTTEKKKKSKEKKTGRKGPLAGKGKKKKGDPHE